MRLYIIYEGMIIDVTIATMKIEAVHVSFAMRGIQHYVQVITDYSAIE